jgi:hypothetical protein
MERCRGWDLQLIDMYTGTPADLWSIRRPLRRGGLKPRPLIGPVIGVPGVPVTCLRPNRTTGEVPL